MIFSLHMRESRSCHRLERLHAVGAEPGGSHFSRMRDRRTCHHVMKSATPSRCMPASLKSGHREVHHEPARGCDGRGAGERYAPTPCRESIAFVSQAGGPRSMRGDDRNKRHCDHAQDASAEGRFDDQHGPKHRPSDRIEQRQSTPTGPVDGVWSRRSRNEYPHRLIRGAGNEDRPRIRFTESEPREARAAATRFLKDGLPLQ